MKKKTSIKIKQGKKWAWKWLRKDIFVCVNIKKGHFGGNVCIMEKIRGMLNKARGEMGGDQGEKR